MVATVNGLGFKLRFFRWVPGRCRAC